jgi:hypothetical protein
MSLDQITIRPAETRDATAVAQVHDTGRGAAPIAALSPVWRWSAWSNGAVRAGGRA